MDPYLEGHWRDVHHRLVTYACDQIQTRLPPDLRARVEERVFLEAEGSEPVTEGYIEIVDAGSGNRVVTVIEFLSPSNKVPGEGQVLYRRKQQEMLAAKVSLVEVDLTRGDRRVLPIPEALVPLAHRTAYLACARRGRNPLVAEFYPIRLADRLPAIRIPLRETDADVPLELQPLVDQCYHNGRYDNLNYRAEPNPPLCGDEAAWAAELLRSQGLR